MVNKPLDYATSSTMSRSPTGCTISPENPPADWHSPQHGHGRRGRCKQFILLPKDALAVQINRGIKLYKEGILEISFLPKAGQFIPDLIDHIFVINLFLLPAFERVDVEYFAAVRFSELAV